VDDGVVADDVGTPLSRFELPALGGLSPTRLVGGLVLAVVAPALLTAGLVGVGERVGLAGDVLVLLIAVVVATIVGGVWAAVVSALLGSTLLNYFFIPPVRTFEIRDAHNIWTVAGFVLVGLLVGGVVHRAASTASAAARAGAEARTLAALARATLGGEEALPTLLEQMRLSFGMTSVSMLRRAGDAGDWVTVAARGPVPATRPEQADVQVPAADGLVIALSGRTLGPSDRLVLGAFAAQATGLMERDELARAAAAAARLEASERLRDALLAALGHDLRTPLASARAAVTSLRSDDVTWSDGERSELLATADESLGRLGSLVSDLLDLSRLRAGVLAVVRQPIWLDEIVPPALDELGPEAAKVVIAIPDDLPPAVGDAALVMRVLVNVIGNALRHAPGDVAPLVTGWADGDRVEVRVVDHGPGIPARDRERVFSPFQRLGDRDNRTGLGIGLALSRGLAEAMDGTLEPEETPDGGLTMVLRLPAAQGVSEASEASEASEESQASGAEASDPTDNDPAGGR
jgi:two-component system sensor histidine kinase KdpD